MTLMSNIIGNFERHGFPGNVLAESSTWPVIFQLLILILILVTIFFFNKNSLATKV